MRPGLDFGGHRRRIMPQALGNPAFLDEHGVRYAYVAGSMVRGISSEELVIRMGRARLLAFFGTGGLDNARIEKAIRRIRMGLPNGESFGMNLLHNPVSPRAEDEQVDLYLRLGIECIEASAFMQVSPGLVRYRLKGLRQLADGHVVGRNRIIAKISRPEVAFQFMSPAPERIVAELLAAGHITHDEARLSQSVPLAQDICVEADSGGHTDNGVALALLPAMFQLRDRVVLQHRYPFPVRIGAAGGLGTPAAAAAAFVMGADFIETGSINHCTIEAGTSELVKNLLEQANVQDMEMAPAGDMFEIGAKVQVLKKGLLFPARANKLYDLYTHHSSLDEIDPDTRRQLETKYFKKSFDEVYEDVRRYFEKVAPEEIQKAKLNPKHRMALVFRWYLGFSNVWALQGRDDQKVNLQIHCGPALGSFNQWVRGSSLESWRNRHVDEIAELLMEEASVLLGRQLARLEQRTAALDTPPR